MLASKLDKKPKDQDKPPLHMPTIMKNKKMSETSGGNSAMFRMINSSSKGFQPATGFPPTAAATQMHQQTRIGTAPNNGLGSGRPKTAGLMADGFPGSNGQNNRPMTGAVGQPNGLPAKNSLK